MNLKLDEHVTRFIQIVQLLPEGLHNTSTIPQFGILFCVLHGMAGFVLCTRPSFVFRFGD